MFQMIIPKRSSTCVHGGELLTPGMEYFSILSIHDDMKGCERRDYCSSCWNSKEKVGEKSGAWRSVVPKKLDLSELPKRRDERAFYLLREALRATETTVREEAFVLALYLARRRRIYQRQEIKKANQPYILYEVAETEEMLCVPKVELSDLKIEHLQQELAKKFSS